jgi:hypothetical protein
MGIARSCQWLAVVALAGALQACGTPNDESMTDETRASVRSGSPSLACEWPAVVALDLGCTATLVHPEVIVYAAHCGTGIRKVSFGEDATRPARVAETQRCEAHPRAALGNGFDVAFCLLGEPVTDVPVLPIAAGCELDGARAGTSGTLVGFGVDRDDGAFGIKRSAPVVLGALGPDLVVVPATVGSCAGDSGGPLLIDVLAPAEGGRSHRVLGVLSAASMATCEPSTEHYSYLPSLLPWLESASERELTPCFASDGTWAPGAHCSALSPAASGWSNGCSSSDSPEPLATCGPPFARALRANGSEEAHCTVREQPTKRGATPWIFGLVTLAWSLARRRKTRRSRGLARSGGR